MVWAIIIASYIAAAVAYYTVSVKTAEAKVDLTMVDGKSEAPAQSKAA